jgi:hypothetical protein
MSYCRAGNVVTIDCRKHGGESSVCEVKAEYAHCTSNEPCGSRSADHGCDGSVLWVCDEDKTLGYLDCAREDTQGTCTDMGAGSVMCGSHPIQFVK